MPLTSGNLTPWSFATIEQLTSAENYRLVLSRVESEISGLLLFGLAIGVVGVLVARRNRTVVAFLLLASAAPVLIHFNLYVVLGTT